MAKRKQNHQAAVLGQKVSGILLAPGFVAAVVFFLIALCSETTAPGMAIILSLGALAAAVFGMRRLRERFSAPLAALGLLVLWSFIASLYAPSGAIARLEMVKLAAAFALAVLLVVLAQGTDHRPGLWMASVLAGASAIMSFVSIDLLSTRLISGLFQAIVGLFSNDYSVMQGLEAGTRMLPIIDNPNVYAGIAGLGVLLSLGLVQGADTAKQKYFGLCCLFVNALGFLLAFSMGGTAVIVLAFISYLLLERRERRGSLLVRMLLTLALTLVGVFAVSLTSLDAWDGMRVIPLLCAVVGAALLCLADRYLVEPAREKLAKSGKWVFPALAAVLAVVVVFAVAACSVTGSLRMSRGDVVRRAVRVTGDCALMSEYSGDVTVRVESQNRQQTITHTYTELYSGSLEDASFTVEDDAIVVWLEFAAQEAAELVSVTCGDAVVPLDYPLLPSFVSNRLQGLWANQNAIQRVAFFSDGLKLFSRSPVVGLGLGSFENGLFSVQPFYYETRHVHNHYIQLLADTGIIGLAIFLGLLVFSARAVLRARKREDGHVLIPALGAALVFMAGHAAVEVVFSFYAYLPFAFGVFALIGLVGQQEKFAASQKTKTVTVWSSLLMIATVMVTLLLSTSAADAAATRPTPQTMISGVKKDAYHWADYARAYLGGASTMQGDRDYMTQADGYAEKLAKSNDRTVHTDVAVYYFQTGREAEAVAQLERALQLNRSDPVTWATVFDILEAFRSDSDVFVQGVSRIGAYLARWQEESLAPVEVKRSWEDFLNGFSEG